MNFAKFLRTFFLQKTSGRLLMPEEMSNWTFLLSNKDFYEVKHLHEVAYTAPCLIFFRNLFQICQGLELVVQGGFVQGKIFRVKSPEGNCPGGSFMGINSPGVIFQEGNYSGVIIQRAKVWRVIFLGRIL